MLASNRIASVCGAMLLFAALMLVMVPPAFAQGPLLTGEGEGVITSVDETLIREAGGNRIAERVLEGTLTGTLEGTFREEVRGVVHRNGRVTFHGTLTFEGTAEGCGAVTVTARLSGRGQAGDAPVTEGTFALVGQQDATGHGTVMQAGPLMTYEVQYICR